MRKGSPESSGSLVRKIYEYPVAPIAIEITWLCSRLFKESA